MISKRGGGILKRVLKLTDGKENASTVLETTIDWQIKAFMVKYTLPQSNTNILNKAVGIEKTKLFNGKKNCPRLKGIKANHCRGVTSCRHLPQLTSAGERLLWVNSMVSAKAPIRCMAFFTSGTYTGFSSQKNFAQITTTEIFRQ